METNMNRVINQNFSNQIYHCQTEEGVRSICAKVDELCQAVFDIHQKYKDGSILYYKIEDEAEQAKVVHRHLMVRLGTMLFKYNTATMQKDSFVSAVSRIFGFSQNKRHGVGEKKLLEVTVKDLTTFLNTSRANQQVWLDNEATNRIYIESLNKARKVVKIVDDWRILHSEFLPTELKKQIENFCAKAFLIKSQGVFNCFKPVKDRIKQDHLDVLKLAIIEKQRQNIDVDGLGWNCTFNGETFKGTALHYAIMLPPESMYIELIEYIVDQGGDPLVKDDKGKTVLDYFEEEKIFHLEIHKFLQRVKADILEFNALVESNQINVLNHEGKSLLHRAVRDHKIYLVKKIIALNSANVNVKDATGATPLHYACQFFHESILLLFSKFKSKFDINIPDNNGNESLKIYIEEAFKRYNANDQDLAELLENKFKMLFDIEN